MPDESCRRCGGQLIEYAKCSQCLKPNVMICKKCAYCTTEQFHLICSSLNADQTNTVHQIKLGKHPQEFAIA